MVIFLYGQDTYRMRQKLREIIARHKKTHQSGLNLVFFDGESLKFEDLKDTARQVSMFNEKKLLIIQNIFANQDFKDKFSKNYKIFLEPDKIILFYQESEFLKKDKFFNFLKSKASAQNFEPLKEEKVKLWAKKEFLKQGARINQITLNKLVQSTGSDLWLLSNEIKKLVFFKKGKEISLKDIDLLVKPKIETAIFKTIDAISERNKKRALLLIAHHLEKGEHPLYLLSMINFQFRNILIVKDLIEKNKPYYLISKLTRLHPFVVRKSFQQANKFTLAELKKIYQKIFQADLDIKTGRIDPETALDLLIAEI